MRPPDINVILEMQGFYYKDTEIQRELGDKCLDLSPKILLESPIGEPIQNSESKGALGQILGGEGEAEKVGDGHE